MVFELCLREKKPNQPKKQSNKAVTRLAEISLKTQLKKILFLSN